MEKNNEDGEKHGLMDLLNMGDLAENAFLLSWIANKLLFWIAKCFAFLDSKVLLSWIAIVMPKLLQKLVRAKCVRPAEQLR